MDAQPAATLNPRRWLVLVCLIVTAFGVAWPAWDMFGPARRPMLQGWDDSFYYYWLPSAVIDHDLDFTNQLEHSGTIDPATRDIALSLPRTRTGLLDSKYPPGWAIASLPFFLVAHLFAPHGASGFEPVYLISVWLGQLLYAGFGLWLAIKLLQRYFSAPIATTAVLLVWLASPLVYYQTTRLSMSHSQVFTLAMAVFWLTFRVQEGDQRARTWILLGFSAALLLVTRNAAFVYLLYPAFVVVQRLRNPRVLAWLLAGAAAPAAAQLLAWKIVFGSWIAYSYGGERFDFANLHLYEVLFSPRHGWFYWHPVLLVGIAAFAMWAWRKPEGRAWLISLLAIVLFDAAWPTWWLGSSFGHRGFEVATFFAMIGFGAILARVGGYSARRKTVMILGGAAATWNLALLALFLTQRIPREEAVTYRDAGRALVSWISPRR